MVFPASRFAGRLGIAVVTGLLNDQKPKFDRIGEDATAASDAWSQTATESWAESWKEAWAEMRRSALGALNRLQKWLERSSASDQLIPV